MSIPALEMLDSIFISTKAVWESVSVLTSLEMNLISYFAISLVVIITFTGTTIVILHVLSLSLVFFQEVANISVPINASRIKPFTSMVLVWMAAILLISIEKLLIKISATILALRIGISTGTVLAFLHAQIHSHMSIETVEDIAITLALPVNTCTTIEPAKILVSSP